LIANLEESSKGYENAGSDLALSELSRYSTGHFSADGGVTEIVAYSPYSKSAYAVNGQDGVLTAISLSGLDADSEYTGSLEGIDIDVSSLVSSNGFEYGDLTSVAISPDGTRLAVAIQEADYSEAGLVALFSVSADGAIKYDSSHKTGVQPDMVVFADDATILTADEGEPREGYGAGAVDPKGSVSIISLATGEAKTLTFDLFDSKRAELAESGVVIKKGQNPSTDFEPEYIAVSSGKAYVTLQESNAVAVLDLSSKAYSGVYPLGLQDYSVVPVDLSNTSDDGGAYSPAYYANAYGVRMPDGIAAYEANGKTYVVVANEGDSRDWEGYSNEDEYKLKSTENVEMAKKGRFLTDDYDGLPGIGEDISYLFGSRSFSVFESTETGLDLVFDSKDDFERLTAQYLPDWFNSSNDDTKKDSRSNKKGPEPETVAIGMIDGRTYAFVTLERIGGVMAYDVTEPESATFVNYINSRDFSKVEGHDNSAEGLCFIPKESIPTGNALLVAAFEVSGDVSVYSLSYNGAAPENPTGFTILFDAQGGTVSPAQATTDASGKLSVLPVPAREGYVFKGWFTASGTEVTSGHVFTADETVLAKWEAPEAPETPEEPATFNIPFDAQGGTVSPAQATTDASGKLSALPVPAREGYVFKGWFTASGAEVTSGHVFMADETVLAKWEASGTPGESYPNPESPWSPWQPSYSSSPTPIPTKAPAPSATPVPRPAASAYPDVKTGDWFADSVKAISDRGFMVGTNAGFEPYATMTRAMFITVIARASGVDTSSGADWFSAAVAWAQESRISDGTRLNESVTREQIVAILWRSEGSPASGISGYYSDMSSVSPWAREAVLWAVKEKIIFGYPDGTFKPQSSATRAEAAAMVIRWLDRQ
jgi:uncharacterized repeat protein (TIGR02543 family)